jgi:folate-binding protein YgfZ
MQAGSMMTASHPLRKRQEDYAASLRDWASAQVKAGAITAEASLDASVETIPFGPPAAPGSGGGGFGGDGETVEIVSTYGLVEAEYAAIRRGAGLVDRAQRGVLAIRGRGRDRRDFLNRLLTQELKDLEPGVVRESFIVNRMGRIEADVVVIDRADETLIDLDRAQRLGVLKTLASFVFTEEVEIEDASGRWARLAVHGREAADVVKCIASVDEAPARLGAREASVGGGEAVIARLDQTGEPGFEVFVAYDAAVAAWDAIVEADRTVGGGKRRVRPIGWYAFNIARIEAGEPLMNIDFGVTSLPHETGVLKARVSFTKGCYPGQEVVARMEHLGRPKQQVVGLAIEGDALPVAGAQVFAAGGVGEAESASGGGGAGGGGDPIGVVTSSTLSPMLGAKAIAFATLRSKHAAIGTAVYTNADGAPARGVVHDLTFWRRGEGSGS